jgi:uncharacterized protein YjbI with pentapeptide repeats
VSLLDLLRAGNVAEFNTRRPSRSTLDFFAADLSNLSLVGVDLSGANLEKADFTGTDLTDANLARANLAGADFTEATLDNCQANKARMREAFFGDARAVGADFSGADLGEADLTGINARNAIFTGARLKEAVLQNAHLIEANFTDARIGDGDLRGADLGMAKLCGADLHGANLGGARLAGANLRGARMARATLRHADLTDACLANADLTGADLSGSALQGTDFTGADLFDAQIDPDALRAARGPSTEDDTEDERVEIHVEDPSVAVNDSHVAVIWENADGEDVLTLRVAIVAHGATWDGRALPIGISGDGVIARALVACENDFMAMFFLDKGGVCELHTVRITPNGERAMLPPRRLDYQPAVTPIVATEGGRIFIYGIGRQGALSVNEWTSGGLLDTLRAPAGTWRGFCSRHEPILLGKGGTMAVVRPDGIGPIKSVPKGFPGRLQSAASEDGHGDSISLLWTQKDEQGLHLVASAKESRLYDETDIGTVDLIRAQAGSAAVRAVWMCEEDENIPMFARLPDGAPRRVLSADAIEDLEDLHFVHSLRGTHVALISMNGECVVVDISPDTPRILARIGA